MTQANTTDRDPIDPQALADDALLYLLAENRDEADVAFEAALLAQGVMRPDEAIEQITWATRVAQGVERPDSICVRFDSGEFAHIKL